MLFFQLFISFFLLSKQNAHDELSVLSGTEWRLVQCNYDNKLRTVNHRATLTFADDLSEMIGNDGCSDINCQIVVGFNKITVKSVTSPGKKSCVGKEKLTVAKNFISTLRNHTSYKISGNYLTFYNGSIARLVFAKIITDGEESTIIKRSYKVDPVYYNKGGRKYLKLYDFVSLSNIYIEKIAGFSFVPGYIYNIEMKTTVLGEGASKKTSYELIRVVSKVER